MRQFLKPLHLACGNDDANPSTMLIGVKGNHATAANGVLMVKLDLTKTSSLRQEDIEMLDGKYIHKETWKSIHKCDELTIEKNAIHCHANGAKKTFYFEKANTELWDNDVVVTVKEEGQEAKRTICHSAAQMDIISKVFQEDRLNQSFSPKRVGTVVYPDAPESGMFAILKPEEQLELNRYLFTDK